MIHLLLVEDHPCTRLAFTRLLSRCGIKVEAFDSVESAEAALETLRVDVALLDCRLPGRPGTDLAAALQGRRSEVKVVLMSAEDDYRRIARDQCPGIPFLRKPIAPERLVNVIIAAAERGHQAAQGHVN